MKTRDFKSFAAAINKNWEEMKDEQLFIIDIPKDEIWAAYLGFFPEGQNPIFRTNTEHDGSVDRQFIKNIGNVVCIRDGQFHTVWDAENLQYPYDVVAGNMAEMLDQHGKIRNLYVTSQAKHGAEMTIEDRDTGPFRWHHLHAEVPRGLVRSDVAEFWGKMASNAQVFRRGLSELTLSAIDTILELIEAKNLYRGEEHLPALKEFRSLKAAYDALNSDRARDIFVWQHLRDRGSRFRNTVIGSLAIDLSASPELLEDAVRIFESKVAPSNYKRPKALVTEKMIQEALDTLDGLGLRNAVYRRHARITDISVNDILWVDRAVEGKMKDSLMELLAPAAAKPISKLKKDSAEIIDISVFMEHVLPSVTGMQVLVENRHQNKFVNITAPMDDESGNLFHWGNSFGWSYDGDVTDSIQQRVKAAGGRVQGAQFRVSLAWFNTDDLDLHMIEPNGNHIYFGNKCRKLDVDMNASGPLKRDAVENISFMQRPKDGYYQVNVDNYSKRENVDMGFDLEVESNGQIMTYSFRDRVTKHFSALGIKIEKGVVKEIEMLAPLTTGGTMGQDKWGITTETLVPVQTMMLSPNHWDGASGVGHKHYMFMLEGMVNPEPVRGLYNEFLRPDLHEHRRVFELLGSKTKAAPADEQLAGLGFGSTKDDSVIILTELSSGGKRPYNIQF